MKASIQAATLIVLSWLAVAMALPSQPAGGKAAAALDSRQFCMWYMYCDGDGCGAGNTSCDGSGKLTSSDDKCLSQCRCQEVCV